MANRRAKGLGSVYPDRQRGGYVGQVVLNGRKHRVRARTQAEAWRQLAAMQKRLASGVEGPARSPRLAEYLERWLASSAERVRPRTLADYRQKLERHVIPHLGHVRLDRLTPQQVEATILAMPVGGRTKRHVRAVLQNALAQAQRWGLVERNAAALTTPPRVTRAELPLLSPDELLRFIASLRGDRDEALYLVAMLGLRQSEILGLRWSDIGTVGETRVLHVRQGLHREGGRYQLREPKSARSRRVLPLPPLLADALEARRRAQHEEYAALGVRPAHDLVFTTPTGAPRNGSVVTRQFHRRLAALNLPRVTFHSLRHGTATFLAAAGVDMRTTQAILGHSTITMTADVYTRLPEATVLVVGELLQAWLAQAHQQTHQQDEISRDGEQPPPR